MLRGKVLNVLKTTEDNVLENQELFDIITKVGAGYKDTFDLNKMKFDKIVIVSDQFGLYWPFPVDGWGLYYLLIWGNKIVYGNPVGNLFYLPHYYLLIIHL